MSVHKKKASPLQFCEKKKKTNVSLSMSRGVVMVGNNSWHTYLNFVLQL